MTSEAFIVSRARTPIGSFCGSLSTIAAPRLGAVCIKQALEKAGARPDDVDEVILGNVISAGLGQNPARQASIHAGLPTSVGATTVNKVCGSGLKAVLLAAQSIRLGEANIVAAGGMENMSLAPHLLPGARSGYRLGGGELVDAMIHDGLWDCYGGQHMGVYGEQCADKFGFSRQAQDDFAVRSYTRARAATAEQVFADEIAAVEIAGKRGATLVTEDEEPSRFDEAKLRALKPAFTENGTITAGNASSINDGAAALVVASAQACKKLSTKPLARIIGGATFSREPDWFTIAPIDCVKKLLGQVGWTVAQVDLFEINEAFAAVALAAETELKISPEKLNLYGGAVALGHPIGASGARILATLLTGLVRTGGKRGIACLCIGGGEAIAMAVEMVE